MKTNLWRGSFQWWHIRWPMGHGHYSRQALIEAVAENKRIGWAFASAEEIAQEISASLFVRGFGVVDEDFLRMTRGDKPEHAGPGEAHRAWLESHR